MTVTYLRGGLSSCSVVWLFFSFFFLMFINLLMQLCRIFFLKLKNQGSYLLFQEPYKLPRPFCGVQLCCACLRLLVLDKI